MARLRAETPKPPACPSKTTGGEAEAILVASVGSVVERPREIIVFRKLVVVVGAGFRVAWRRQEAAATSQASGITSFPWKIQTPLVMAGRGRPSDLGGGEGRGGEGRLEQARLFFVRAESGFVGGFVEDMGDRIVSAVSVSSVCSQKKAIEGLTTRGAVCPRQGSGCEGGVARKHVRSASQSQRSALGPPTNQAPVTFCAFFDSGVAWRFVFAFVANRRQCPQLAHQCSEAVAPLTSVVITPVDGSARKFATTLLTRLHDLRAGSFNGTVAVSRWVCP